MKGETIVPAVKYDYYNQYDRRAKGVARSAMPVSSSSNMSAQRKVSSNYAKSRTTSETTRNSVRAATSAVAATNNKPSSRARTSARNNTNNATTRNAVAKVNAQTKKRQHADIDIPISVKKKIEVKNPPKEMKLKKPKSNAKAKAKVEGTKRRIVLGTLMVSVLFFVCFRYTEINEKFNEVNALEKELNSTTTLNQQLSTNIESKTDLSYIEKYAKYQLGMQKPDDSQIVRIAYEKHDKISTPVVIDEKEEDSSFWNNLFNDLKNLID